LGDPATSHLPKVRASISPAALPSFSITSVKTYAKTGIGCIVFQHKREDNIWFCQTAP
jgi:hypothetical protein